jgi:hypothetical protein
MISISNTELVGWMDFVSRLEYFLYAGFGGLKFSKTVDF